MHTEALSKTISDHVGEHGKMSIYVNVNGSLVALDGAEVEIMRDSEGNTPILVLNPKGRP